MLNILWESPLVFFIVFPGILLSITIHEYAHCLAADLLGDPTPRSRDRLTLNPLAHLDPIGTIMMLFSGFGWGKPAPFDPYNLKKPLRDTALIAAAGPASNLLIALIISIVGKFVIGTSSFLFFTAIILITINVSLAIFNLIPIHPLDGSKIFIALLPKKLSLDYEMIMRKYGLFILIILIAPLSKNTSPVSQLISPIIDFAMNLFSSILLS